jgi:transposase
MIMPGAEIKVLVAMKPVDFREKADSLAALVQEALSENPYSGGATGPFGVRPTCRR